MQICKMEKYKTLNDCIAKDIIRHACLGKTRIVYMLLYNYRDAFVDDVYHRICGIIGDIAPLTLDVFKTLPYEVQYYYNSLWLNK